MPIFSLLLTSYTAISFLPCFLRAFGMKMFRAKYTTVASLIAYPLATFSLLQPRRKWLLASQQL